MAVACVVSLVIASSRAHDKSELGRSASLSSGHSPPPRTERTLSTPAAVLSTTQSPIISSTMNGCVRVARAFHLPKPKGDVDTP